METFYNGIYRPGYVTKDYFMEKSALTIYEELESHYEGSSEYRIYDLDQFKALRDPVNRSVEFYASKIMPEYEIISENQAVIDAINQVHKWSNFDSVMQVFKRQLALYGDLFIRISTDVDKVYFECIKPEYVTDFIEDNRGFLQAIRIDIPVSEEGNRTTLHTEYWDKESYSIWETFQDPKTPLASLGDPMDSGYTKEFGIDFIPIVHIKFKDIGEARGKSCVIHALRKIETANKNATRLDDLVFVRKTWVLAQDPSDPQDVLTPDIEVELKRHARRGDSIRAMLGDNMMVLPEGVKKDSLIPELDWQGILGILNALMNELEQDLPELRYYSIEDSNLSGKAIRLLLGAAIDRAKEAQNNFVQGITRADSIALTLGKNLGLFSVNIGDYESGSFDHEYKIPEMFEQTDDEKALTLKSYVDAGFSTRQAMQLAGYSEEEIISVLGAEVTQPTMQTVAAPIATAGI